MPAREISVSQAASKVVPFKERPAAPVSVKTEPASPGPFAEFPEFDVDKARPVDTKPSKKQLKKQLRQLQQAKKAKLLFKPKKVAKVKSLV